MIKYHTDLIQGTPEWYAARCGILTASEMKHIITPAKLQYASNDKERAHLYELVAQRITKYVEPHYISDDMMRGKDDEVDAKVQYEKKHGRVTDMGFITNDRWGFTLGYSPDGLFGDDLQIEIKGRRQKYQIETIIADAMPDEFKIQAQTGLLVSERPAVEFISYCGGLPMFIKRVPADLEVQEAIVKAATIFHEKMDKMLNDYAEKLISIADRLTPTERRIEQEITL